MQKRSLLVSLVLVAALLSCRSGPSGSPEALPEPESLSPRETSSAPDVVEGLPALEGSVRGTAQREWPLLPVFAVRLQEGEQLAAGTRLGRPFLSNPGGDARSSAHFTFDWLPPGRFAVGVLYPDSVARESSTVEVSSGQTAACDVTFRPPRSAGGGDPTEAAGAVSEWLGVVPRDRMARALDDVTYYLVEERSGAMGNPQWTAQKALVSRLVDGLDRIDMRWTQSTLSVSPLSAQLRRREPWLFALSASQGLKILPVPEDRTPVDLVFPGSVEAMVEVPMGLPEAFEYRVSVIPTPPIRSEPNEGAGGGAHRSWASRQGTDCPGSVRVPLTKTADGRRWTAAIPRRFSRGSRVRLVMEQLRPAPVPVAQVDVTFGEMTNRVLLDAAEFGCVELCEEDGVKAAGLRVILPNGIVDWLGARRSQPGEGIRFEGLPTGMGQRYEVSVYPSGARRLVEAR